jgi:glycosyltransferase involved in cell wall biosynthesis
MLGLENGQPLIACACRATLEKGVDCLLYAFNKISTKTSNGPRPALVYVGDGPQFSDLQALRNTLQCSKDIYLIGYRKDAILILEGADLCVVPSIWQEAFSLSVLETMALGKPVIATRVGGIPELIEHDRTGLLVPPSDNAALADAMQQLLMDPFRAARLGKAARQRVADVFTPEQQLVCLTAILAKGFALPHSATKATPFIYTLF